LRSQERPELEDPQAVHLEQVDLQFNGTVALLVPNAIEDDDVAALLRGESGVAEVLKDLALEAPGSTPRTPNGTNRAG
jgi:hypothetical protein